MSRTGSLLVVGTGLKAGGQLTFEARSAIEHADKVFYTETNPLVIHQIHALNDNAERLTDLYGKGKPRPTTYVQMTERIVTAVRQGMRVCAVFYGHPGIFAKAPHDSIRLARAEGYEAHMLAGVSAEDCLFADLGIDPGMYGCQSFEANDFLIRRRVFDRRSTLVLWQVGLIGNIDFPGRRHTSRNVPMLVEALLESYPADHEAIVYEAAQIAVLTPRIERIPVSALARADFTATSTLVICPDPAWNGEASVDMERVKRLGFEHQFGAQKQAET